MTTVPSGQELPSLRHDALKMTLRWNSGRPSEPRTVASALAHVTWIVMPCFVVVDDGQAAKAGPGAARLRTCVIAFSIAASATYSRLRALSRCARSFTLEVMRVKRLAVITATTNITATARIN